MLNRDAFVADLARVSAQSVPEVLETMFFAAAVPGAGSGCGCENWSVAIPFRGAPSGVFTMRVDRPDAHAMASAFLGRDPEETGAEEDAFLACELANILCGSVLSRAEADGTFDLGAPLIGGEPSSDTPDYRADFLLDTGGALEIGFAVSDEEESHDRGA